MTYLTKDQLLFQIREDWHDRPSQILLCETIFAKLVSENEDRFDLEGLRKNLQLDKKELIKVLPYLTGDRTKLLDICFEFIEDGNIYSLSHADISIAHKQGVFLHPIEREPVEDFDSKIFMYFCPHISIRRLRGDFEPQLKAVRSALTAFLECQTDYFRKDIYGKLFVRRWAITHGVNIVDSEHGVVWCDRPDLLS
jgi:hypothetical protein